jgi:hypothetical protein
METGGGTLPRMKGGRTGRRRSRAPTVTGRTMKDHRTTKDHRIMKVHTAARRTDGNRTAGAKAMDDQGAIVPQTCP